MYVRTFLQAALTSCALTIFDSASKFVSIAAAALDQK